MENRERCLEALVNNTTYAVASCGRFGGAGYPSKGFTIKGSQRVKPLMAGLGRAANRIPMRRREFRSCKVLARTHAAVWRIRKPFICQVKPLEAGYPLGVARCNRKDIPAGGRVLTPRGYPASPRTHTKHKCLPDIWLFRFDSCSKTTPHALTTMQG